MNISQVTTLIGARRYGDADTTVSFLLTDSRSLAFPEETLFFALRTPRGDGADYLTSLYQRGVRQFVVHQAPEAPQADANYLVVPDTLAALQRLAERHRDAFRIPVVGITGSNGKTIVKEWLYQLLAPQHRVTRSPRSYNSQIGVPLSVWNINAGTDIALIEAGISQPDEMRRLADIIQPTIGIFTSLGQAHQENFHTLDDKCREKLQLFRDCHTIIVPLDNDTIYRTLRTASLQATPVTWSRHDDTATIYIVSEEQNVVPPTGAQPVIEPREPAGTLLTPHSSLLTERSNTTTITYRTGGHAHQYTIPFISQAAVDNSITCLAAALALGLTPEQIAQRMPALEPVAMRLEVKQGVRGLTIINDTYNSDLASLDIALDFMQRRTDRQRVLILSDIDQTGLNAEQLRQHVADITRRRGITQLITIGQQFTGPLNFPTTDQALASTALRTLRDATVLIKGARRFRFDRIADALTAKVHETTLEVNLTALVANLNHYRAMMRPDTRLVCMIKADAYGAGAVEIARTLQDQRVDYLAVAVADEGVTLRHAGITANIMVMNPEMSAFKTLFDYHLEPEVYSFRLLDALRHAARQHGITGYPVHIKLDTGMHRLGFDPDADMPQLVEYLTHQQALTPRSVFSHFVGSDGDEFDDFSAWQFEAYTRGADALQAAFQHHILRHICNSAGIEHFPERHMDMCRLGLGLYGINPRTGATLHCVSTLRTTILQLRHVPQGDTIGYSRRTTLQRDSLIAAIPIGYADGLNRRLGNRNAYCLVHGKPAPYVGNICMDVCMIDVTDIPCQEGDTVEIFGPNLPVQTLADTLGTIPYEPLTLVSTRVKRVYYEE